MTLATRPRVEQRIPGVSPSGKLVNNPKDKKPEVHDTGVRAYVRELADKGEPVISRRNAMDPEPIMPGIPRDEVVLNVVNPFETHQRPLIDTSVDLVPGYTSVMPISFGDMSFGALNARAVMALIEAANRFHIISGTGEGGVYQEILGKEGKFIQWASARFGVTLEVLQNEGLAVVIKIGQGAKPGLGGQLQKDKVMELILKTRRMPAGIDLISPAPHHDVYSIEDLGQRIKALKLLTGLPIYVKVAATHYTGFIACGVARMGGAGIIIDGSGAGTGASPITVRDNCGLPIELALAWTHELLKAEGLRNNFKILAGGTVRNSIDVVKLMALGADAVVMGTAPLIAMGCAMVHQCHNNKCPTLIAMHENDRLVKMLYALAEKKEELIQKIADALRQGNHGKADDLGITLRATEKAMEHLAKKVRVLDVPWAVDRVMNFLKGLKKELEELFDAIGVKTSRELTGNKNVILYAGDNEDVRRVLGLEQSARQIKREVIDVGTIQKHDEIRIEHVQSMAETGKPVVASMGTTVMKYGRKYPRQSIYINAAQVTAPSQDPYRELIETAVYFNGSLKRPSTGNGRVGSDRRIRLSAPMIFDTGVVDDENLHAVVSATAEKGTFPIVRESRIDGRLGRYLERGKIFVELEEVPEKLPGDMYNALGLVVNVTESNLQQVLEFLESTDFPKDRVICRISSEPRFNNAAVELAKAGAGILILDGNNSGEAIEFSLREIDTRLRSEERDSRPLRYEVGLLVQGQGIWLDSDIAKLVCLGADAVVMDDVINHAIKGKKPLKAMENFIEAAVMGIKLLAGANGLTDVHGSMRGNLELLRAVGMPPEQRERIGIKPAGVG